VFIVRHHELNAILFQTYANYEFSKSLCLHMEITGMPHYQLFADQICGSKLSNADRLAQLNPAILVALKILLLIPRLFSQSSAQHSESTIQFAMLSLGRLAISVNRQYVFAYLL
jgi:hypothetical protein